MEQLPPLWGRTHSLDPASWPHMSSSNGSDPGNGGKAGGGGEWKGDWKSSVTHPLSTWRHREDSFGCTTRIRKNSSQDSSHSDGPSPEEHGKLCLMWKCTVAGTTAPSEGEKEDDALKESVDRVSDQSDESGDVLPKDFHCWPSHCYSFSTSKRGAWERGSSLQELLKVSSISLPLMFWLWE